MGAEPESLTGGLFGEYWWPTAADYCHKRLAQRAQGLPEDPLAHGVLSWIEYELALSTDSEPRKPSRNATTSDADKSADEKEPPLTEREEIGMKPLPVDTDWRWLLRGKGEIVGPKG